MCDWNYHSKIHSLDIQVDQTDSECGVTRSIINELHSWHLQGDQTEGETGVSRSIIDETSFFEYPRR